MAKHYYPETATETRDFFQVVPHPTDIIMQEKQPAARRDLEAALPAANDHDSTSVSPNDEAMAMVGEQEHALDPAVVARAVRKIDWFLIPAMVFGCACFFHWLRTMCAIPRCSAR